MIKEPVDVNTATASIKVRKEKILKMAKEVSDINTVNKEDSVITGNTINVHLDEKKILEFVSKFGDVSSTIMPILISLTDNGQNGVAIQWKLTGTQPTKTEPSKIKFEWMETQKNDDEKEQWQQREIQKDKIEEVNEQTINIDFGAELAFFAIRLRIFDEVKNEWSLPSNAMTVQMKNNYKLPNGLNESILIKGSNVNKMMMENVLPQALKNKKFELLLRGSEHGLTHEAFRDRCKDKGSILVIVQNTEYERTFGGYTKIGFSKGSPGYQKDDDAFLFYIDPKTSKAQRFDVIESEKAVYSYENYGVFFGAGSDLYLRNNGKVKCTQRSYDYPSALENISLSGGRNGGNYVILDYEVWKII